MGRALQGFTRVDKVRSAIQKKSSVGRDGGGPEGVVEHLEVTQD